jgi:hypothetical protein
MLCDRPQCGAAVGREPWSPLARPGRGSATKSGKKQTPAVMTARGLPGVADPCA